LLVHDGKVFTNRMQREQVTAGQLAEACRERVLNNPADAKLVVLEVDGSISVLSNTNKPTETRSPKRKRRKRRSAAPE
jgi:uncharacterized membrane protein YcaP (DUF421 family)